jgi:hypothetical protein
LDLPLLPFIKISSRYKISSFSYTVSGIRKIVSVM